MSIKHILIIVLLLLLIIPSIKAYNQTAAYDWLISKSVNGSYNNDIIDTSLAILALSKTSKPELKEAITYLKLQKNTANCFPLTSCKVEDTSFALSTLKEVNEDIAPIEEWFKNAQSTFKEGNFLAEIVTSTKGSCFINYNEKEKEIKVENGKFPQCSNQPFLNLNTCIEPNLLLTPSLKISIDCSDLTSLNVISLLYNLNNIYQIISESNSYQTEFTIPNSCFGISFKDTTCSYQSTLYANLFLNKIDSDVSSLFYLEKNYDSTNVLSNIILSEISSPQKYKDKLIEQQSANGGFRDNIYNTALAAISLKNFNQEAFEKAISYLKTKQKEDGSWNTNVRATALSLYAISAEAEAKAEQPVQIPEEAVCNNDEICDTDRGESSDNCPDDCPSEEAPDLTSLCSNAQQDAESFEEGIDCGGYCNPCPTCNEDGICDTKDGETIAQCPNDCLCNKDEYCDTWESIESCPEDCIETREEIPPEEEQGYEPPIEEEKKSKTWIALIIIPIIGIIIFFLLLSRLKKPKKKPTVSLGTVKSPTQPYFFEKESPKTEASRERLVEEELKRSMEESKKFIRK